MPDLPKGWIQTTLENVGQWCSGGTPSRKENQYFGEGIFWIKSGDLPDGLILKVDEQITLLGLEKSAAKLLPVNTISMAMYGATIGKLGILSFPAATNQACANVISNPNLVETKYLFYYLLSERKRIIKKGKGGAQPNISQEIIKLYPVVIAPLNEQRRIVAKLEKLLAKVNACQERLDKICVILRRLRQSILAGACSGRLTADWREQHPDIEPAEDLLKRIFAENSVRFQATQINLVHDFDIELDVPASWKIICLGDIGTYFTSGSRGWAKYYSDRGAYFIRAQDINTDRLILDDVAYVDLPDTAEGRRSRLEIGDLLITMTGANVSKAAIINVHLEEAYINQHVGLVRLNNHIYPQFVYLAVISPAHGRYQLLKKAYGAGKPGLNLTNLKELFFGLPPLEEQQEIVRRVENLFQKCDQIEARYQKAKAYTDKLTQAILAKAFRGELVPQDPNDEPAEVLLERIKAEKAGAEPQKKRRQPQSKPGKKEA